MRLFKNILTVSMLVAVAGLALTTSSARANSASNPAPDPRAVDANISLFYDDLAPYGEWVQVDRWGWCWTPRDVPIGWRPYSTGHWVFSDECGWTWVADETWGWAPFHYGRWFWHEPRACWMWVPGNVWGPAWVAWRNGGGFCGWRALPPEVGWHAGVGLELGNVNLAVEVGHPCWNFCEERFICEPHLHDRLVIPARTVTFIERTRDVTHIVVERDRVVNRSVDVSEVERITNHRVERVNIRDVDSVQRVRDVKTTGHEVAMFRPHFAASRAEHEPVNHEIAQPKMSDGDLQNQQHRQADDLRRQQEAERGRLQEEQQAEMKQPPDGQRVEAIQRAHEAERQALAEQHRQQVEQLQRVQQRERERGDQRQPDRPGRPR